MKKVTKADIIGIAPGATRRFYLETPQSAVSARQYAYMLGKVEPADGVKRYSASIDYSCCSIAITAIPE